MNHASSFVNLADSDEDYVSMDEDDMETGLQNFNDDVEVFQQAQVQAEMESAPPQPQSSSLSNSIFSFFSSSSAAPPPPPSGSGSGFGSVSSALGSVSNNNNNNNNNNNSHSLSYAAAPPPPSRSESMVMRNLNESLKQRRKLKKNRKSRRVVRRQRVNANVVSIDLFSLGSNANEIATGDPFFCSNPKCKTVLASINELTSHGSDGAPLREGEMAWTCQFCTTVNVCDIDIEEKPTQETVDYILEPPTHEAKSEDENNIIFCVDVSGSMCVTQEVQGRIKLRGDRTADLQKLNDDRSNQFLPGQKRNTTYISRLQAVQAAVEQQITNLAENNPRYTVGLVSFSNDVTIFGDGTSAVEIVTGDKLHDLDELKTVGTNYNMEVPVSQSKNKLSEALFKLEEKGQTCLGPALVVSIALAAQRNGSRVMLCTDGLANIGLGALDGVTEEQQEDIANWYEQLGVWALQAGVTVNVVSITDDGCRLENLGKVTDLSQGEVQRINPLELTKKFAGMLEKAILATNAQARMFIHPGLKFRSHEEDLINNDDDDVEVPDQAQAQPVNESVMSSVDVNSAEPDDNSSALQPLVEEGVFIKVQQQIEDVGNVFDDTRVYFEYNIVRDKLKNYKELNGLPFQVQLHYTRTDGAKMLRVITQKKPITTDREQVLQNLNMDILSKNASRKSARLCEDGDYEAARVVNYSNAMWMGSNARSASQMRSMAGYMADNTGLDNLMMEQQQTEARGASRNVSKKRKKKMRKAARHDAFSSRMYASKRM